MHIKKPVPLVMLHGTVDYNHETGNMVWKARKESMFRASGKWTADQLCNSWNKKYAGKTALSNKQKSGHMSGEIFGMSILAHRAAFAMYHGIEVFDEIDHINGDPSDNRIDNLREVRAADNRKNTKIYRNNSSGVMGVSYDARWKNWKVTVGRKYVGRFKAFDDAVDARKIAEKAENYHQNHGAR